MVWGSGTTQKTLGKHPVKRCLKETNKVMCPHAPQTHSDQGNKSILVDVERGGKSPERALRSSVMYEDTQSLGSGLISSNDDDSELLCWLDMGKEREGAEERRSRKPLMKD